ncbi:unnamed protein product [Closterium sp. NIES-54]
MAPRPSAPWPLGPLAPPLRVWPPGPPKPPTTATAATAAATAATATTAPLLLLLLRLLLLLPSLSQPLPPRTPPSLPAMTSLRRSSGSRDNGGGSSGSGGDRPSSRCGVGVVAAAVVAVALQLFIWELLEEACRNCSGVRARPFRLSKFVSGTFNVGRLGSDTWRAQFGDATKLPRWLKLVRQGVDIFTLDYDAIHIAMYALSTSAEGDCSRCVPPDPGIAAAALDASESGTLPGTAPAQALHTFTLDSGASRCFFRDCTTLTPLPAPVPVRLADPSGGLVVARSSTILPCSAVPSGSLSGLHLPSFSTNLVIRLRLRERFGQDLPVLRLHSDRGGEFSSDLLRDFCCGEGIRQSFTFPDSPKQNEIAERRIGLVMEVARTSMIHIAAPHFLWPFAVRYTAHQHNLWPRVFLLETLPTLRWRGEVSNALVFWVWGFCAFVHDTSADKLSARAIPCVFLGFVPDPPGWQFYHPTSRRVFPSQDVTFDESVPFYRLFSYRSAPPPPPSLFLAPGPPPVDPLPPQGPAPSGVSHVDPLLGTTPVQVAVGSGAAPGAASGGAASRGAEPGGAESEGAGSGGAGPGGEEPGGAGPGGEEPGGAEPTGVETGDVEPGGTESEGADSGGAEPRGAASSGGPARTSRRLSPQQLCELFARRPRLQSGATRAGDAGDAGAGGAGVTARAGGAGAAATSPGGARTRGTGAAGAGGVEGAGAGDPTEPRDGGSGAGAAGAEAVDPRAGRAGDAVRPRPYFVPLLQQVLGVPSSTSLTPPLLCPPPDQTQLPLQLASPLPAPSPYTEHSGGLTECREPASRPVLPVRTARRVPRSCPPLVPGTHAMALRPSSVPLRVPLPAPPESYLLEVPDPECDRACASSPIVALLLATAVTDPSFESAAASALVAELLEFAGASRLNYATALAA